MTEKIRQILENKKAKNFIGSLLLVFILMLNFLGQNIALAKSPQILAEDEISTLKAPENVIITESTYQLPAYGQISQGYHWYHPAIDISTQLGENVFPVTSGKVTRVEYTLFGYGHYLLVDHGNHYYSLYAHLGEIKVNIGQEVDKNTVLGQIGLTGRTTGPHLHLEILKAGSYLNPLELISIK